MKVVNAPTPAWRRYLRFWRSNPDADVADEVRFHLESAIAEYVAMGMTPDAARAEARRRFGDLDRVVATLHTLSHERERAIEWRDRMDTVRSDVRFALRQLRKSAAFTIVAVLTLALGIGANSAIFSIVYSVLLRPLPYAHAERLLKLRERNGASDTQGMAVTFGNYASWVARVHSFEAFGAYHWDGLTLTGAGDPRSLQLLRANAGYWKVQYIPPVLGRYFETKDDAPGAPNVVVISHSLWQSAFAADSSIIGRAITLSGLPYTVVAVASPLYTMPAVDAWVPLALTSAQMNEHADHELSVVGLVREGVPANAAVAELAHVEAELASEYPNSYFDGGIIATSLRDSVVGPVRALLLILLGAVGLVLLIACVNIANLQLARAAVRRKEIAVRNALGAGRGRIVAQLFTESVLLALAGAIVGLVVAAGTVRFLIQNSPLGIPRLEDARLNAPVLAFAMLLALACGVAFGLFPAVRASRLDLQESLREGARSDAGAMRNGLRATLVVCQISLAMVLLIGAGLLVRSATLMQHVPPGFDTENVLVTYVGLPNARYSTDSAVSARFDEILHSVASIPGVASAALVSRVPIAGFGMDCNFRAEGGLARDASFNANVRVATPAYFETLRIPLLRGQVFSTMDRSGTLRVALINRRLAHKLFGDSDPMGRRITCSAPTSANPSWLTVIGITGDLHASGLGDDIRDEVYSPMSQSMQRSMAIVARGSVPVMTLAPSIRRVVASLDPLLPLSAMRTMEDIISDSLAAPRFTSALLSALGALGLALAVIGIYGVIAYFVAQRTNEIGIRMALGADSSRVLSLVVRQGLLLGIVGIGLGLVASWFLTQMLNNLLYGVTARDPVTFIVVAVLLSLVSIVASMIPARRAARVDPLVALRTP
jgi:putative ABC transport system permease protein